MLLERALALDPNYCEAHWRLALVLTANWIHGCEPQEPNRLNSIAHAQRAVDLDPSDSDAHSAYGFVLTYERRWDEAEAHFNTSFRISPNDADTLAQISDFKVILGKPQEAVESAKKALRLNPHAPGWYYGFLGQAQTAAGEHEEAVKTLRRGETYRTVSRRDLYVALAKMGRILETQEEARFFISANPGWGISYYLTGEGAALKNPKDAQFWVDGYRKSGLPE